jgi:hypothetical protein
MANGAGVPDQFEGRVCPSECLFEQAADLERVHRALRMGFRLSTLPKINFREIREHETSEQRALEELCYQLVPTVHALAARRPTRTTPCSRSRDRVLIGPRAARAIRVRQNSWSPLDGGWGPVASALTPGGDRTPFGIRSSRAWGRGR